MLCGIHPPSNQHQHRFLRSFRSHKSLRQHSHDDSISSTTTSASTTPTAAATSRSSTTTTASTTSSTSTFYPFYPDDTMMMNHPRRHRPSDASSLACPSLESSSRRPSTASGSSDVSIDWDPLRLNPPTLAPGSPPPLLHDSFADLSLIAPPTPTTSKLRHAQSTHSLRAPQQPPQSSSPPRAPPVFNTVIYEGFDFGFSHDPTPPSSHPNYPHHNNYHPRRRAPSLTPSDASSECSLVSGSASSLDESQLEEGLCLGLAPPPAPRARPRPQREGVEGGEAEEFIRRGAWKRRGIVFGVGEAGLAGEEETFEI